MQDLTKIPIPPLSEPPNWARLPIVDCDEPLVPIDTHRLRVHTMYADMGIPEAPTTISVRAGVLQRLFHAERLLPPGFALCVFDGYRPLAVQQWLYDSYAVELRQKYPTITEAELASRILEFVASPNADPACPPPHRTGGAVDVYLVDTATDTMVPMGTQPDETSSASATHWYEEHPEEPYTTHRRILFHAMMGVGFANYLGEWWHYDFGNQRWANVLGKANAIYGIPTEGNL